jgi:hypothetical protein
MWMVKVKFVQKLILLIAVLAHRIFLVYTWINFTILVFLHKNEWLSDFLLKSMRHPIFKANSLNLELFGRKNLKSFIFL